MIHEANNDANKRLTGYVASLGIFYLNPEAQDRKAFSAELNASIARFNARTNSSAVPASLARRA